MHNFYHPQYCWCLACGDRRIRRNRRMSRLTEAVACFMFFAFGMGVMWLIQH